MGVAEEQLAREIYRALYSVDFIMEAGQIILFPHRYAEAVIKLEQLMVNLGYQVIRLVEIRKG